MGDSPETLPLRDIHLPEPVSWWPLAPGWWLLLAILVLIILVAVLLYRRYRSPRRSALRQARRTLTRIRTDYAGEGDDQCLIRELSALLRRTAVSVYKRDDVAALIDRDWLMFLDSAMAGQPFSDGAGQVLASGPYQPRTEFDAEELFRLCDEWLRNIETNKSP